MKKPTKKKILFIIIAFVLIVLLASATVALLPKIRELDKEEFMARMQNYVDTMGSASVLLMLALQILQVFISIIPGEPVEIVFGFIYGPWIGTLLCLVGITIAAALIFLLVERFGRRFVDKFTDSKQFARFKFLHDPIKRDALLFVLFLIPGTPKDTLIYLAPFTKISLPHFLLLTSIARIPSIISSAFVGAKLYDGDIMISVIIFASTVVIGALGILLNNKFIADNNKGKTKDDD